MKSKELFQAHHLALATTVSSSESRKATQSQIVVMGLMVIKIEDETTSVKVTSNKGAAIVVQIKITSNLPA